jgi:hypothetical protein
MRQLVLLPMILLIACTSSNDEFTPTTPSPGTTIPTIGGTYSSPAMWRFELTSAAEQSTLNCAGSLTIGTQIGDSFSGTFLILDNACGAAFSGVVAAGVYRTDGGVTFDLNFAETGTNFVAGAFGCTYASGDRSMTGTLIGTRLQAEARTELDCVPDGRVTQVMRLAGDR